MKNLVTGGCGFIGSHLCEALIEKGRKVRVLDNLSTGHEENLEAVRGRVEIIRADIRDREALASAMEGVDKVYHLAAVVSVDDSVKNPMRTHEVNATGSLNVLEAAREKTCQRLVLASTCAVYGNAPGLPKKEDMLPEPESPYSAAKLMGEHYCRMFSSLYGLETASLRFFNVYGPRQDPSSPYAGVISRFVSDLQKKQAPNLHGDGKQTRDFVFVADIVRALMLAMESPELGRGEVLNVGTGKQTSLLELISALGKVSHKEVTPTHGPARQGDVRHSRADTGRLENALGFRPKTPIEEGLSLLWKTSGSPGA